MSAAAIVALGGLAALILGLVLYERTRGGARELGLVAVLVAAATAGRIAFAAIPSAQPVTAIAIVTGVALGPRAGAAVGAGAALLSNTFLGQGPWTPWQMLLWGLAGASGGWLAPLLRRSRIALMAFGGAWGLVFGAGMDIWQLAAFGPALTLSAFIAVHARAVPFDIVHALTNVILLGVAGLPLIALLERSARRMRGRWLPAEERP
jgi:energy-coupling factor transport system substrate-specific component